MTMTRKDTELTSTEMRNSEKSGPVLRTDRCESCGASLRSSRLSVGEMAANAVCGILLLSVLTLVGYIADRCLERNEHKLLDQPVWHEPLDSWSL